MIRHFIIVSSSYSKGTRIAVHYVVDGDITADFLSDEVQEVKKHCGENVSISTHYIETDSPDWESIVAKDSFFASVQVVENLSAFVNLISIDRKLRGLDIARYILSQQPCTHLRLEKMVYMCYADYLCYTNKRLFEDKIFAFQYGPVIESVYEKYRGRREIISAECSEELIKSDFNRMSVRSRILFAEDGVMKLSCVRDTLKKYQNFSASQLVAITHVEDGPWYHADREKSFSPITDDMILAYRHKEAKEAI